MSGFYNNFKMCLYKFNRCCRTFPGQRWERMLSTQLTKDKIIGLRVCNLNIRLIIDPKVHRGGG